MDSSPASNPLSGAAREEGASKPYAVRTERERVLEAMVRVAARKGYGFTTVAEVVEAAGVTRREFDEMFAGKEACFLEAYDAAVDVLLAHTASAYARAAGQPWAARVVAALRSVVELLASEADIARMAVVEVTAVGEDARIRYRRALRRFEPFLDEGRAVSPQGRDLPSDTAGFAIGAATSMIFDEIRAGRGAELPRVLPDLAFLTLMPYLGAEAAEAEMERVAAG
jgi:AcrR family transcriptional regulator